MTTLQNKIVVVVGGSSGIGFGVALAALQSFASVVIIASSNADRVAGAVARLQAHKLPGEVRGEVLDAKDAAAVKKFALSLGAIDHVAWTSGDVQKLDSTDAFSVRFWGPLILAQNATFRPGGSLTFTSGILDVKPRAGRVVSAGVCSALEGLAKGLAVDLAPIRVNVIGPGAIETEIWDKVPIAVQDQFRKELEKNQLIKRIGEPQEIAEAYLFLMKCGYITGERINVDGGVALA
ncbi:hypothetical protein HYPSUDRAFT_84193 [Hypholoma sublateritium FD-334 SS-4]|uniref:Uncharacterized protein n=1 Tax=Hypholoma sublateritium (strain FD-334 SS-4) TaxID=945553 RepID=A0A0D2PDZ9_HYPSF|nr:hypothetical protein HYPSUDRAFT_84193 [Hypholoma sublateritium FD-334 SS-4]